MNRIPENIRNKLVYQMLWGKAKMWMDAMGENTSLMKNGLNNLNYVIGMKIRDLL